MMNYEDADVSGQTPASAEAAERGDTNKQQRPEEITCRITPTAYGWRQGTVLEGTGHTVGLTENPSCPLPDVNRMYLHVPLPTLPRNPRLVRAELTLHGNTAEGVEGEYPSIGLYITEGEIAPGAVTPAERGELIDYARLSSEATPIRYTFDVTTFADMLLRGELNEGGLVLRLCDEEPTGTDCPI